jgi:hypothetical protein
MLLFLSPPEPLQITSNVKAPLSSSEVPASSELLLRIHHQRGEHVLRKTNWETEKLRWRRIVEPLEAVEETLKSSDFRRMCHESWVMRSSEIEINWNMETEWNRMKQNSKHPESQTHLIWQRSFWDRPPWDDHEQTRSTRRECLIAAKPKTSNHGPNHGPNLGPCLRLGDDGDMTEIWWRC